MAYRPDENVDLFGYLMYRVRLRPKDTMDEVKASRRIALFICALFYNGTSVMLINAACPVTGYSVAHLYNHNQLY